jgi:preprotein translocase subunit YajC
MEALFVLAATFVLLWVLFILPRQRQVRAHQQLVASLETGDEVILTAGIFGRIVAVQPDEVSVEVAPGVDLRVARQAVLRRVEPAGEVVPADEAERPADEPADIGDIGDEPPGHDTDPPTASEPR